MVILHLVSWNPRWSSTDPKSCFCRAKCPFRRPLGPPGSQALRSTAQFWLPASGALEQQRNWKMSVRFRSFSAHAFLKDNRSRRKYVHQVGKASVVLYQIYIFSKRGSVYLTGRMPRITFPEFMCQCNAWNLLDLDVLGMSWVCLGYAMTRWRFRFLGSHETIRHPLRFGEAQWPVLQSWSNVKAVAGRDSV